MSKELVIEKFCDSDSELIMKKTQGYIGEERAILIEESGHMILLEKEYVTQLKSNNIPREIIGKLLSRNFIQSNEESSDDNNSTCECVVRPEFFMIDLTRKCNMHCKYCLRDISSESKSISTCVVKDICKYIRNYCKKYKLKDITIQPWGGEPLIELDNILLMRQELSDLETHVHFSIETNALLLTEEVIEQLYDNKIGIGISIDGYKELHDKQRVFEGGCGTHKIVEKNLLCAKEKYGNSLGTITTVTRINAAYIENILEYYAVNLGLRIVKFNYVHESMFTECQELCLSKEEIAATEICLLNKLVELNEKGFEISEHNISVKLKNILTKEYTDICHSCGCTGGKKMIVFDMNGNYYPCELTDIPDESIGNIYDDKDLIVNLAEATKNKDFFVDKKDDKCVNCMWYVYCKGGCTVRAISIGKRPPSIDEIECAVNMSLYPALLELIVTKPKIVNKIIGCDIL